MPTRSPRATPSVGERAGEPVDRARRRAPWLARATPASVSVTTSPASGNAAHPPQHVLEGQLEVVLHQSRSIVVLLLLWPSSGHRGSIAKLAGARREPAGASAGRSAARRLGTFARAMAERRRSRRVDLGLAAIDRGRRGAALLDARVAELLAR